MKVSLVNIIKIVFDESVWLIMKMHDLLDQVKINVFLFTPRVADNKTELYTHSSHPIHTFFLLEHTIKNVQIRNLK